MVYNEEEYLGRRFEGWRRLALLCDKASRTFRDLTGAEIVEYVRLYRQTSGDLAYLAAHSSNREVVTYLNSIVSRAYGQLYRTRTAGFGKVLKQGLWLAADTFRRRVWFVAFTFLLFLFAAFYTSTMMTIKPETRSYFVGQEMEPLFAEWRKGGFEGRSADESVMMTGFYASNNPKVGIMTIGIAAGTAGIGSTILIWKNGVMLGALGYDMFSVGKLGFLLSSIMPHGVSEMGGIFVAGAAGYVLAFGLLFPGSRRLVDSLKHSGKDAFVLAVLALIMIFAAAPIEGFFSFNPLIPQSVKVAFALVAISGWTAFLGFYGRKISAPDLGLD
ncbi:MAG: stage II sporulation protein M [Fimbriimonadaceae bacterium]